jgi:hypothetical protein
VKLGILTLDDADLRQLADVLRPYLVQAVDDANWFTPEEYAARGWAPSAEAARRRAGRNSIPSRKQGARLFLQGPSNEGQTLDGV